LTTRTGNELAEHLARILPAQIHCLDAVSGERIVRVLRVRRVRIEEQDRIGAVDDDAAVPGWQVAECLRDIDPAHSRQDDIGARSFLSGTGLNRWTKLSDKSRQGLGTAAVRDRG
jgi:hypothetical protein